jgi:type II secretory ATPase GspE/PulE/Tfp pilus assembly ATPase PilB-like protein
MYHPEPDEIRELFGTKASQIDEQLMIPRSVGCDSCRGTGYSGQIGIFEVLMMNERIREMTLANASASQIKRAAMSTGMKTLRGDGWRKVTRGITTVDEVMRVTMEDEFEVDEAI